MRREEVRRRTRIEPHWTQEVLSATVQEKELAKPVKTAARKAAATQPENLALFVATLGAWTKGQNKKQREKGRQKKSDTKEREMG